MNLNYTHLALSRDEVVPMGVFQIILPGGGNKSVFFFLTGTWTDNKSGTFTMYMFDDKNEDIIEESEQEVSIKKINDFELLFTNAKGQKTTLNRVNCK
jgi:hypothetical protein